MSFFLVPSQSSSKPLYPPQVLRAKEHAPILDSSVVFTSNSHLSLSKSLGVLCGFNSCYFQKNCCDNIILSLCCIFKSTLCELFCFCFNALYGFVMYISLSWIFASIALRLNGQIPIALTPHMKVHLFNVSLNTLSIQPTSVILLDSK